jgi:photosystem II stability/assembly factor-like uncharacterized protein
MNLPPLSRLLPALALLLLAACTPDPDGPGNTDPDGGTGGPGGGGNPDSGTPNAYGWHRVTGPGKEGNVSDIFFLDAQRGWMTVSDGLNRGVFSTSNGGASWTHQKRDYSAFTVTALADGNSVWVAGSESPTLFASTNGGQDLAPLRTVTEFPRAIHFWDATTGIIASEVGDRVKRTTDSGATWTTHAFTREIMPGIHELAVLGDEAWVVGGPMSTSNGTGANIGYSADRGATWSIKQLEDKTHDYKGGSLQGVAVVNTNEIWVAGLNRQLYFTKDKMQTWTQVRNVPSDITDFRGIAISGDHIVAGCHTRTGICIYESFDHGATWALTFTEDCGDLCDVRGTVFAGLDKAYIYGYNGTLVGN